MLLQYLSEEVENFLFLQLFFKKNLFARQPEREHASRTHESTCICWFTPQVAAVKPAGCDSMVANMRARVQALGPLLPSQAHCQHHR